MFIALFLWLNVLLQLTAMITVVDTNSALTKPLLYRLLTTIFNAPKLTRLEI